MFVCKLLIGWFVRVRLMHLVEEEGWHPRLGKACRRPHLQRLAAVQVDAGVLQEENVKDLFSDASVLLIKTRCFLQRFHLVQRRLQRVGDGLNNIDGHGGADHHRHVRLDDAGFLFGDFLDGVAEHFGVVE